MKLRLTSAVLGGAGCLAMIGSHTGIARETTLYIGGSIGGSFLGNSSNEGRLTEDFLITNSQSPLDGTTLPDGTPLSWETEFHDSATYSGVLGLSRYNIRVELEAASVEHDVDVHDGFRLAGVPASEIDAAALLPNSTTSTSVSVGDIIGDARGSLQTTYWMANLYIDADSPFSLLTPYFGGGVGIAYNDLTYAPSGLTIVDGDEPAFAYQFMAGASYAVLPKLNIFAELGYRGTSEIELTISETTFANQAALFDGQLDIENGGVIAEIGLRYDFSAL